MAINMQTFRTRALTALVFVAVMALGLLLNQWSFFILFTVIHFGCWHEYKKIAGIINPGYKTVSPIHAFAMAIAGWGFMMWMMGDAYKINGIILNEIGWKLMIGMFVISLAAALMTNKKLILKNLLISIGGFLYISFSCGCMMDLRSEGIMPDGFFQMDLGLILPVLLIVTMWINDTMAYIVGSLIGKTQLTTISPKKTWEGTIGGVVLAVAAITISGNLIFKADVIQLLILSTIACITGIFGDLFESKLKRKANIKDSGQIMPGHGGFLDRFDSLLFATVFVWLYIKLFM